MHAPVFDDAPFQNLNHTVQLSKLSFLDLSDLASRCYDLLTCVSHPPTTTVRLQVMWPSAVDFERIFSVMISTGGWGNDGKSIRSLFVERNNGFSIRFRCRSTAYRSPSYLATATSQIELIARSISSIPKSPLMVMVCKALPLSKLQTLRVTVDNLTVRHWLDSFGNYPRLRTISLDNTSLQGLLQALDPMEKSGNFLSPQLRTLMVSDIYFEDSHLLPALRAYLHERSRRNNAVKELHLADCEWLSADYVRSLEGFVGEVIWDQGVEYHSD
jgi:hypothetical protein